MAPPRILLCGDVLGRLNQLYKRVSSVNKSSGPFDALLCVGQFFPDDDNLAELTNYVQGGAQIPVPTYFIGDYGVGAAKFLSSHSPPLSFKTDGLKICHNLYWLKGSGKFSLHGLTITYLSGKRLSGAQLIGAYTQDDIDALRAWAEEPGIIDLFLTNEWPSGVTKGADISEAPAGVTDSMGTDPIISDLVAEIKPRYHVAGTKGVYYAREPYANIEAVHVTRFLGLAPVGNKDKQKFIHAISPTPVSSMSAAEICSKPPNTTPSPFELRESRDRATEAKRSNNTVPDAQYWRYDVSQKRQRRGDENSEKLCFKFTSSGSCSRGEKCNFQHSMEVREQYVRGVCFDFLNKGKCEKGPDCNFKHNFVDEDESASHGRQTVKKGRSKECWFCLSSPNVESHLILCIGQSYYCALAKGPLVEDHVLIIPIEHSHNTLLVSPEEEAELGRFRKALKSFYKNQGKEVVFFEWVFRNSSHANLQAVPIPLSKASVLQKTFNMAAEKLGFKFQANNSVEGKKILKMQFNKDSSFLYVELPEGKLLTHTVKDDKNFLGQFGREVLAGLLNVPDRADWRNCALSEEDGMKMAENFKERFADYDPTS